MNATATPPWTILCDGDHACWVASAPSPDKAGERAVRWVRRAAETLGGGRVIVCFSDESRRYWRHELFGGYKPNRSELPAGYADAADALRAEFAHRTKPGLEADDVMGILATHPELPGQKVIVSRDSDLLTVPGLHYDPQRQPRGLVLVGGDDADFNFLHSVIVGNSAKGLTGVPGVGFKKAGKVLWGPPPAWWPQVVQAFKSAGRTESDALLQARLARICRYEDWDAAAGRVIPWEPKRASAAAAAGGVA